MGAFIKDMGLVMLLVVTEEVFILLSSDDGLSVKKGAIFVTKFHPLFPGFLVPMHFLMKKNMIVFLLEFLFKKNMSKGINSLKIIVNPFKYVNNTLLSSKDVAEHFMVKDNRVVSNLGEGGHGTVVRRFPSFINQIGVILMINPSSFKTERSKPSSKGKTTKAEEERVMIRVEPAKDFNKSFRESKTPRNIC